MRPRSTTLTPSSGSMTSLRASSTWSKSAGASAVAMGLRYADVGQEAIVAFVFQTVCELGPALFSDLAVDEDVHEVGLDVAQDARVVRDEQEAEAGVRLGAIDALGDDLERVDVEAGVGLVEDRELGLEEFELKDLVALLLAAREPLVDVALGEGLVHAEGVHRLADLLDPRTEGRRFAVE